MNRHLTRHYFFRIAALLAILCGALAPAVHAYEMATHHSVWIQVCSSTGNKLVLSQDSDHSHGAQLGSDCPYCHLQQDLPAIAHAPGVRVMADGSVRDVPTPPEQKQTLQPAFWPVQPSRAPPSLS